MTYCVGSILALSSYNISDTRLTVRRLAERKEMELRR